MVVRRSEPRAISDDSPKDSPGELSDYDSKWQRLFTYCLLKGLRGAADEKGGARATIVPPKSQGNPADSDMRRLRKSSPGLWAT